METEYLGYTIHIEKNPDKYRGGYEWAVCKDSVEWDCGLSFSESDSLGRNFNDCKALTEIISL